MTKPIMQSHEQCGLSYKNVSDGFKSDRDVVKNAARPCTGHHFEKVSKFGSDLLNKYKETSMKAFNQSWAAPFFSFDELKKE